MSLSFALWTVVTRTHSGQQSLLDRCSGASQKVIVGLPVYVMTMTRTTVYLPLDAKRRLSAAAHRQHRSEAELIRDAVSRLLAEEPESPRPNPPRFDLDPAVVDHADEYLSAGFGTPDWRTGCGAPDHRYVRLPGRDGRQAPVVRGDTGHPANGHRATRGALRSYSRRSITRCSTELALIRNSRSSTT